MIGYAVRRMRHCLLLDPHRPFHLGYRINQLQRKPALLIRRIAELQSDELDRIIVFLIEREDAADLPVFHVKNEIPVQSFETTVFSPIADGGVPGGLQEEVRRRKLAAVAEVGFAARAGEAVPAPAVGGVVGEEGGDGAGGGGGAGGGAGVAHVGGRGEAAVEGAEAEAGDVGGVGVAEEGAAAAVGGEAGAEDAGRVEAEEGGEAGGEGGEQAVDEEEGDEEPLQEGVDEDEADPVGVPAENGLELAAASGHDGRRS